MTDYLARAERSIEEAPQYKDGPEYLPEMIQLGIGQQLRRIADALEAKPEPSHVDRAMAAIDAETTRRATQPPPEPVDLVAALRASVEAAKARRLAAEKSTSEQVES